MTDAKHPLSFLLGLVLAFGLLCMSTAQATFDCREVTKAKAAALKIPLGAAGASCCAGMLTPGSSACPNHRVQKFDSNGKLLLTWGGFAGWYTPAWKSVDSDHPANGKFFLPSDVAIDRDNNVYILDVGRNLVQKFDSEGNFLLKWGNNAAVGGVDRFASDYVPSSTIGDAGEFHHPQGITIDSKNNVYVADTGNHRIQRCGIL